ncbi:MAG: methyl-accepting chemotaxis protein, partial [Deltaproteobacteria bacterium]|nr:methyl-accepting chemotaxis protein [Deltaproteobacteria bacterium]
MTTKIRIIIGFSVMIVLLAVVAVVAYFSLGNATNAFTEYRRLARLNVRLSDIMANQFASSAAIRLYRINGNPAEMENARQFIKANQGLITESKTLSSVQANVDIMDKLLKITADQIGLITDIEKALTVVMSEYLNDVRPAAKSFGDSAVNLLTVMTENNNDAGARAAATVMNNFAYVRTNWARFAYTRDMEHLKEAQDSMKLMTGNIKELEGSVGGGKEREAFGSMRRSLQTMQDSYNNMASTASEMTAKNEALLAVNRGVADDIKKVNDFVNSAMDEQGKSTVETNEAAQMSTLLGSVFGLLVGLVFSIFIIISLVRVLRKISDYANAVSNGDFDHHPDIREKGEVGAMVLALNKIPATLNAILEDFRSLETKIEGGFLDTHGDEKKYSGGFSTIVHGTNNIINRFRMLLDSIPSPVVMFDKNTLVSYFNNKSRHLAG